MRIKPTKANILDNETKRRSKIPDSAASFGSARRVRTAGQLEDAVRRVQVRDIRGRLHPSKIPFKIRSHNRPDRYKRPTSKLR